MVNSESSACHQRCAPQIEVRSRQEQRSLALLNACLNNITPDDSSSGVAARPVCRRSSAEAADLNVLAPSVTSVLPFFPTLAPKMVTRTFRRSFQMTQSAKLFWKLSSFVWSVHSYFPPLETSSIYLRPLLFYAVSCSITCKTRVVFQFVLKETITFPFVHVSSKQ